MTGKPNFYNLLPQTLATLICTALWGSWVFTAFHLGWVYTNAETVYAPITFLAIGVLGIAASAYGWPVYCQHNSTSDVIRFRSGFFGAMLFVMGMAFGLFKGHWYSTMCFGSLGMCMLLDWALKIRLLQDLRTLKWIGVLLVPAVLLIYLAYSAMGILVLSALHINLMPMGLPIEHVLIAITLLLLPILMGGELEKLLQRQGGNE